MKFEEEAIEKYGKVIGLVFFFVGIILLFIVFSLAYNFFLSPESQLPSTDFETGEEMSVVMGRFFRVSLILSGKWLALCILGLVGSWVCNKGIMLVRAPREKAK